MGFRGLGVWRFRVEGLGFRGFGGLGVREFRVEGVALCVGFSGFGSLGVHGCVVVRAYSIVSGTQPSDGFLFTLGLHVSAVADPVATSSGLLPEPRIYTTATGSVSTAPRPQWLRLPGIIKEAL